MNRNYSKLFNHYRYVSFHFLVLALLITALILPASACTLWGSAGSASKNGATLVAKNRDESPTQTDYVKLNRYPGAYRYLGLHARDKGREIGIRAGINEKGLFVASATAGTVSREKLYRYNDPRRAVSLNNFFLEKCDSVETALKYRDLISAQHPCILIIGDKDRVAAIEVAPGGKVAFQEQKDGILYRTNHYLDNYLSLFNEWTSANSTIRLNRIKELLESKVRNLTLQDFITFSHDQHAGADDSLWRTGSRPNYGRTLANWIAEIPRSAPPKVHVEIANPGENIRSYDLTLDEAFWNQENFVLE